MTKDAKVGRDTPDRPIHDLDVAVRSDLPLKDLCREMMIALRRAGFDVLLVGKTTVESSRRR